MDERPEVFARQARAKEVEQLKAERRIVAMWTEVAPMPSKELEPELIPGKPVLGPPTTLPVFLGNMVRLRLESGKTVVRVTMLRDGDLTISVERNGQMVHLIDVDPEPDAPRMTDPNCDCGACTERRKRMACDN